MQIWKPSRQKLAEAQDTIDAQKKLIDALNECKTALEHKVEALEEQNKLLKQETYRLGTKTTRQHFKMEKYEAQNRELREKMQLIEEGAEEAWILNGGRNPEVIKVKVRPNYMYCYSYDGKGVQCHIAHPSNVFRSEEAALKALEKYLVTGETPEAVNN